MGIWDEAPHTHVVEHPDGIVGEGGLGEDDEEPARDMGEDEEEPTREV